MTSIATPQSQPSRGSRSRPWHHRLTRPGAQEAAAGSSAGIQPLEFSLWAESAADRRRWEQLTWAFVGLGVAVRLVRYLLRMPLWGDESFVAANFLDRGFLDLLAPLDYHQVCPLLFLWAQLAAVKLLGYTEHTLRLVPFLAGVASLVLFRRMASRLLGGLPLLLSVAVFAVSFYPIRHSAEVKPYSTDLFLSLALLALAVEWLARPERRWPLWCLTLVAPVAVAGSYPAIFVAGGVGVALGPAVWRQKRLATWAPYLCFGAAALLGFVGTYLLVTARQYAVETGAGTMHHVWAEAFPPLTRPLALAAWLLDAHTGLTFAYPLGGKHGASTASFICVAVAAGVLLRRRPQVAGLLLAPFAVALAAAALHRYPYGGSTRVMLYLAPQICLLVGTGGAALLAWGRQEWFRRHALRTALIVLALVGMGNLLRDLVVPYKTPWDYNEQGFARWFWRDLAHDAELACVKSDLGQDFFPKHFEWGRSALYLCNQRIYSPRHAQHRGVDWTAISAEHPLRCVVYSVPDYPRDEARFAAWLADMQTRYRLVDCQTYRLAPTRPMFDELFEVYEFVPLATAKVARR